MTRQPCRTAAVLALAWTALVITGPGGQAAEVWSDAKLRSFVNVVQAVNEVLEKWQPRIAAATSDDQLQSMTAQANAEMDKAIADIGDITPAEYRTLAQAAQNDPALMARIEGLLAGLAKR